MASLIKLDRVAVRDVTGPAAELAAQVNDLIDKMNANWERLDLTITSQGVSATGFGVDDGDGNVKKVARGVLTGFCTDGETVTFPQPYDSPPVVFFPSGGVIHDIGAGTAFDTLGGGDVIQSYTATVTTTGFTANLKVADAGTSGSSTVDGPGTTGVTQDLEITKSTADEAVDDIYTFQVDVTVTNNPTESPSIFEPGQVEIGIWTNDGTWTKQRTLYINGSSGEASTSRTNQTTSVTVDGLNSTSHQFGVTLQSSVFGGSLDAFDSVSYDAGTPPTGATATPTGAKVTYVVIG